MIDQEAKKSALLERLDDDAYEAAPVPSAATIAEALKRAADELRRLAAQPKAPAVYAGTRFRLTSQ